MPLHDNLPPNSTSLSSLTPYQLRVLVLDYLSHETYSKTARAFIKDSMVRHLDADGDEIQGHGTPGTNGNEVREEDLLRVELREKIRTHILAGRVDDATDMLNEIFPAVLSEVAPKQDELSPADEKIMNKTEYASSTSVDPAHLTLNLRILSFIEACRTVPLAYSSPTQTPLAQKPLALQPLSDSPGVEDDAHNMDQKLALLSKAQKLLGLANALPKNSDRLVYLKELNNVSGLLAYKVPEKSPIARYLSQERREAVADQINRAILDRSGLPTVSSLELLVRQTSTVWAHAHQAGVKCRPGALIPPAPTPPTPGKDPEVVPQFDLHHFLDKKT